MASLYRLQQIFQRVMERRSWEAVKPRCPKHALHVQCWQMNGFSSLSSFTTTGMSKTGKENGSIAAGHSQLASQHEMS